MTIRPRDLCRGLLAALEVSEGRRKQRQRDTTPDAIGLVIKREILDAAVREDPEPAEFEAWLLSRCLSADGTVSIGAVRAMALDVLAEWRLAEASPEFSRWLRQGAPVGEAARARPPAPEPSR